jgi:hypothetical protein
LRYDERAERFPFILSQDAQTRAEVRGFLRELIHAELPAHLLVVAIEIKIVIPDRFEILNRTGDINPLSVAPKPGRATERDAGVNAEFVRIPPEALTALKNLIQIKIGNIRNFNFVLMVEACHTTNPFPYCCFLLHICR